MIKPCCLSGHTPDGSPVGKIQDLGGTTCYIADEKDKLQDQDTPAILIAPDVFGLSTHCQLLADEMNTRSGFPVVVMDYFQGSALPSSLLEKTLPLTAPHPPHLPPPSFLARAWNFIRGVGIFLTSLHVLVPFIYRHMGLKYPKFPLVKAVAGAMRQGRDAKERKKVNRRKLGLIGYCYGGPFAMQFGRGPAGERVFDAVGVCHGKVTMDDVRALTAPGLFVCADNDFAMPEKVVKQAEAHFKARKDPQNYRMRRYPGTFHGFAIRGDERNPVVQKAKEAALCESVDFFQTMLSC